ncbi:hypothetical protein ACXN5S_09285 [Pseudoroseicyclus sp. H15]
MTQYIQLPVSIETIENGRKRFTFPNLDGSKIVIETKEHAAFTKTRIGDPPSINDQHPETPRQRTFERIVRLLAELTNGAAPYRFLTLDGELWRMETSATQWALDAGHFKAIGKADDPSFALKPI